MRAVSLRVFLTAPFLLLFILAAGAISWISYRNAQLATERLASQFSAEVGARIESRLESFFAVPATVVRINHDAMLNGRMSPDDLPAMQPWLLDQIRHLPFLTFVSFGGADGQYVAATRDPQGDGEPILMSALVDQGMTLNTYLVRNDGSRGKQLSQGPDYNARDRPFMQLAENRSTPFWYPVYRYRAYDRLGIGLSAPVRDNEGRLLGVFSADLALEQISRFLHVLTMGEEGIAFVAERNGALVAISTEQDVFSLQGETLQRLGLAEHGNPLLRAASTMLLDQQQTARQERLQVNGLAYLADLRPFRDPYGLDLVIGVILPEQQITAVVADGAQQALLLTIVASLLGTIIGLILTRWVALPVEKISERANRLALGELAEVPVRHSPVREVNALSRSFERMAAELRELIEHLEARVSERTAELESANIELRRLSALDGLTRIANRRRFDEVLEREWQRARREHRSLALILGDVDHFKAFNDHLGHQRGDDALRAVALSLAGCARRPADLAARYGGEEFVMVLPDTDFAGAHAVAESLRQSVRDDAIRRDDLPGVDRVTISVGVACLTPGEGGSSEQLIAEADRQLYRAKQAGRDRVMPPLPSAQPSLQLVDLP